MIAKAWQAVQRSVSTCSEYSERTLLFCLLCHLTTHCTDEISAISLFQLSDIFKAVLKCFRNNYSYSAATKLFNLLSSSKDAVQVITPISPWCSWAEMIETQRIVAVSISQTSCERFPVFRGDKFCSFWNLFCRFACIIRLGDRFSRFAYIIQFGKS